MLESRAVASQPSLGAMLPASLADPVSPPPTESNLAAGGEEVRISLVEEKPGLEAALGDRQNLKVLGQKLYEVATRLGVNATPQAVQAALAHTPLDIDAGSSYPLADGKSATLASVIRHLGLFLPLSHFHLTSLADAVTARALEHPLGDFGGGLSWPVPMSPDEQRRLGAFAQSHLAEQPQGAQGQGLLDFLNQRQPVATPVPSNPVNALESLVSSAEGQRLGKHLQEQMGGIATDRSVNDYLLAAIAVQLDPQSIAAPHRNKVEGFDLASDAHWGKPASFVVDRLSRHLSSSGKTSPQMAGVGAYGLLARKAPEFLVKDIPDRVTYGSPAWVSLAIAAATIEAQSPGKVPNMTFAQVMQQAESAGAADPGLTRDVQRGGPGGLGRGQWPARTQGG